MRLPRYQTLGLVALLTLTACAPSSPSSQGTGGLSTTPPGAPKSIVLALSGEPGNLSSLMEGGGIGPAGVRESVNDKLIRYNGQGVVEPRLSTNVPSTTDGTWTVRPDNTMQTVYRLRPGVTWHDGKPLTARDFAFALLIHKDRDLPVSSPLESRLIDRIETPDDQTVVIEWSKLYPFANAIESEDVGPIPAHLLEEEYRTNKEAFANLAYWKYQFVGVGPYRLVDWQPGTELVLKAYDAYYGGRPKIDTITFKFIGSDATIVAGLLAGTIDGTALDQISFDETLQVKRYWDAAGEQPTMVGSPRKWRFLSTQHRPDSVNPKELLDPRTRRGLIQGIDRQLLAETMMVGLSQPSDFFFAPTDQRWPGVKDSVTQYPYNPVAAQQILAEIGWRKNAEGALVNASGERVAFPIWVTDDPDGQKEQSIIADSWRTLGINVEQFVVPTARQRDREYRTTYPAFDVTSVPVVFSNTTQRLYGPQCPTEENRWTGNNRGCYRSAEMDRLVDSIQTAVDVGERQRLYAAMARIISGDLPVLSLYFKIDASVFRSGITGPSLASTDTALMWNVAEWDRK